ncbi:uncharacterized protein [Rutidosis leptorrhynchoides]|uniref:uncharacterized protein n=1 Tax=Rutidosis leptorrhynchoides TaxID=125765 RepID=UPI003A9A1610
MPTRIYIVRQQMLQHHRPKLHGQRTATILKHLFLVPKPDTEHSIRFSNRSDIMWCFYFTILPIRIKYEVVSKYSFHNSGAAYKSIFSSGVVFVLSSFGSYAGKLVWVLSEITTYIYKVVSK